MTQLFQVTEIGKHIYIMMEHAGEGGQLVDHIQFDGMQEEDAWRMFRQILCAIGNCHKGIMH